MKSFESGLFQNFVLSLSATSFSLGCSVSDYKPVILPADVSGSALRDHVDQVCVLEGNLVLTHLQHRQAELFSAEQTVYRYQMNTDSGQKVVLFEALEGKNTKPTYPEGRYSIEGQLMINPACGEFVIRSPLKVINLDMVPLPKPN